MEEDVLFSVQFSWALCFAFYFLFVMKREQHQPLLGCNQLFLRGQFSKNLVEVPDAERTRKTDEKKKGNRINKEDDNNSNKRAQLCESKVVISFYFTLLFFFFGK